MRVRVADRIPNAHHHPTRRPDPAHPEPLRDTPTTASHIHTPTRQRGVHSSHLCRSAGDPTIHRRTVTPRQIATRTLDAHDGVARRPALYAAGLNRAWVGRAVKRGELAEVFPGVVARPEEAERRSTRLLAALAFAGPDARLSHTTAAEVLGLVSRVSDTIHVAVPHGRTRITPPGLVLHQVVHREQQMLGRYPTVPVAQTLADLVSCYSLDEIRSITARAVARRWVHRDELGLVRIAKRWLPEWELVRAEIDAGAISGGEARYWRAVRESGLPLPELNALVTTQGSQYFVDALWRRYLLGVEVDGFTYHSGEQATDRDNVRQNTLQIGGIIIYRISSRRVFDDPVGCADMTRAALQTRAAELRLPKHLRRRLL